MIPRVYKMRDFKNWIVCLTILLQKSVSISMTTLFYKERDFNPLIADFAKWPNTLKQFVGKLPMNCLSMFDHFVGFAFKGLKKMHDTNIFNKF